MTDDAEMQIVNEGRTYSSLDELPNEIREAIRSLPDEDADGNPDTLEGSDRVEIGSMTTTTKSFSLIADGTTYARWEDVPTELREAILRAVPDGDGDGVPDFADDGSVGDVTFGVSRFRTTSPLCSAGLRQARSWRRDPCRKSSQFSSSSPSSSWSFSLSSSDATLRPSGVQHSRWRAVCAFDVAHIDRGLANRLLFPTRAQLDSDGRRAWPQGGGDGR